jgi:hypothetical protein
MNRTVLALCCALLAANFAFASGDVTNSRVLAESASGENWFLKGGNFRGEHYSPLSQINDETVDGLGLAWAVDLPIPDGISTTPIIIDGVIYFSGAYAVVYAVDATNGEVMWTYDPEIRKTFQDRPGSSWIARVNRGVAVWDGMVFSTAADCRLNRSPLALLYRAQCQSGGERYRGHENGLRNVDWRHAGQARRRRSQLERDDLRPDFELVVLRDFGILSLYIQRP